jgi:hypothetical protein
MIRRLVRCWVCGGDAEGVCRFCGRAICKTHARTKPFLFDTWDDGGRLRALGIEDALHCGVCKPRPDPVDADFLKREQGR